jgi:hypothetical protein
VIPKQLTIEIDSRERKPLLFPGTLKLWVDNEPRLVTVVSKVIKLDAGDYRLAEAPDKCVVERKGSLRELWNNLFDREDSIRQARAFGRLAASSQHPYILVQTAPASWLTPTEHVVDPERLLFRLCHCLKKFGLSLLAVPQTNTSASLRITGTMLLNLMAAHAEFSNG